MKRTPTAIVVQVRLCNLTVYYNLQRGLHMPSYKDLYKTPLLAAKTLGTKKIKSIISACYVETVGKGKDDRHDKLVIEVEDGETRIALNKGNAVALGRKFGEDYSAWIGKKVTIAVKDTSYMGNPCKGIDVIPG